MEQHQRQRVAEGLTSQLAGVRLDLTTVAGGTHGEEGEGGVAASSPKPIWMPSLAQASQSTMQSRSKVSRCHYSIVHSGTIIPLNFVN